LTNLYNEQASHDFGKRGDFQSNFSIECCMQQAFPKFLGLVQFHMLVDYIWLGRYVLWRV